MKQEITALVDFLKAQAGFTAVMGEDTACKLFPFYAPLDTPKPFSIYSCASQPQTKDAREHSFLVSVYFDYTANTAMLNFVDALTAMLEAGGYEVGEIQTGFSKDYDTIVANINLTK